MSRKAIKYLAMAAMFCNHFAYIFLKEGSTGQEVMVDIGYFTAITMCYFIVEGYHYTRSVKNYALRLLVFGILHVGIETDEPEHDVQPSSMSGSGVGCRSCKT